MLMKKNRFILGTAILFLVSGGVTRAAAPEKGEMQSVLKTAPNAPQGEVDPLQLLEEMRNIPRFEYNPSGRRDPFRSFVQPGGDQFKDLPPLQRVALDQLKLVGVASGEGMVGAMVATPDGKAYPVRRGTKIGTNRGQVKEIRSRAIVVEEPYLNIFGRATVRQVVMELPTKKKEGQE